MLTICQKITSYSTLVYKVISLFFTLENKSKEVMYNTICVNYEAKIEAGAGAGARAGAGPSQK